MPALTIEQATTREQLAVWTDVQNAVDTRLPMTLEEVVHHTAHTPGRLNLLARLDGEPVGCARAGAIHDQQHSEYGALKPLVVPQARRRGVGSALFAAGVAHLHGLGKTGAQAWVAGDSPDGLAFAAARGFVEVSRDQSVTLDLDRFAPEGRQPPAGVELSDLALRPDLRSLYELDAICSRDIPGPESEFDLTFEQYEELFGMPWLDRRLFILALAGEQLVGAAMLVPTPAMPAQAVHWLTAVHPDWRGRGIASALKERQLTRARELGIRRVRTSNELRNAPMRRINERLGYVREPDEILVRGPLPPAL